MSGPDAERREILVGCAELPAGMARRLYFQKTRFLEARLPSDQVPGDRILRRWRNEAGAEGRFAVVAPRELCELHLPAADMGGHAALARRLADATRQLGAAAVVFPTPTQVTPSSTHRDTLRRFFDQIATADLFGDTVRIWQPDGLWRPPVAARVARELGVVPAQDPLAPDPLEEGGAPAPGEVAYVRVPGLGRASRPLGDDDLARLAEWLEPCRRGYVVFDTPAKLRDAIGLSRWVGSSGATSWN